MSKTVFASNGDALGTAVEKRRLQDPRIIVHGWDGRRNIANLFSKPTLSLLR